jgi:hypothetical protein
MVDVLRAHDDVQRAAAADVLLAHVLVAFVLVCREREQLDAGEVTVALAR